MGCKTVKKSINGLSNNHDDSLYFRVQYSCVWFISVIEPVTTGSQLDFVFYLDSQGTSSALFQSIQLNATCKRHCPPYAAMLRLSKAKFISKNDTILVMEKISPFISLRGGGRSPNQQFLLNNYLCNRKLKIAEFLILIVLVILNLVLPVLTTASKQRNQAVL